jgi:hypothetical protein
MAVISLSQEEFNELMEEEKHYKGTERFKYPLGGKLSIPLHSVRIREEFILDISRSSIKLSKSTLQNRVRVAIVMVRLDINSSPHRNPDGEELPETHFHIYRSDAGDKWAFHLPEAFTNPNDINVTLDQFMDYCKIVSKPIIDCGLF